MTTGPKEKARAARPRGRPRLDDVAQLERRLLAIALKEFLRHGYGGASLARIIKAAAVSKTTLYSRYASKEELFRSIMYPHIDRLPAAMVFGPERHPDLESGLRAFANYALEISLKGDLLEVNRLIFSESNRFPELGRAAADRMQMGISQIAEFIRQSTAKSARPCKDPDAVAEAFILMTRGWYVNVMLTKRKVTAAAREKWVERAVHVLLSAGPGW